MILFGKPVPAFPDHALGAADHKERAGERQARQKLPVPAHPAQRAARPLEPNLLFFPAFCRGMGLATAAAAMRPARRARRCPLATRNGGLDGYFRRDDHGGDGIAGAVLRAAEHLGQHRKLADGRVQGNQHELSGARHGREHQRADLGQRDRKFGRHQQRAGRDPERVGKHLYGGQRRRLFHRRPAHLGRRQSAGVQRREPLHSPRRLPGKQPRLPGQRRRLLPDGHPDRPQHRQPGGQRSPGAAVRQHRNSGARDAAESK